MWQTITFPFESLADMHKAREAADQWRKEADAEHEVHEIFVNNAYGFEYRLLRKAG